MAKKKTKKKTAKPKRPAKPRKPKPNPQLLLLKKINRIRARVPQIEPTGECIDPDTREVLWRFTEAQKVFEIYREECETEGLIYRPYFAVDIMPTIVPVGRGVALVAPFCIEDIETGARIIGWGVGQGDNGSWSANTSGTRALKQFLLTTFQCTWQDPEDPKVTKEQMRENVVRELEADGTLANIESIRFWAKQLGTSKKVPKYSKKKVDHKKK